MTSILRMLFPGFNPPATVESVNVAPGEMPEMPVEELSRRLDEIYAMSSGSERPASRSQRERVSA